MSALLPTGPVPPHPRSRVYVVWRSALPPVTFMLKWQALECWNAWRDGGRHARLDVYTLTGEQK